MQNYVQHLEQRLREIDRELVRAAARFENGATSEKVEALSDLNQLRIRHDDLASRIAEAKERRAQDWSSLRTGFQEEADGLKDTIERWLTKLS